VSESQPDRKAVPEDGGSADVAEARDRFKVAAEAEEPQRRSTLAAKKFLVGDQWDEAIKLQRQGAIALQGQPAAPPRPCFVLDCVSEPHQQIVNAISASDFAVKIAPHDGDGSDQTAEVLQGLIRQIQNDSRTEDAMTWAGSDAAGAGIGWALVCSRYCEDDSDDQELYICRIPNSLSVYADPAAMKRDKSDMRYAFITQDMPKSEVKRKWPKADLKGLEDFRATGDDSDKEWVTDSTIRIATYFHCEYQGDECIVHCDTINAVEVLESEVWGGSTIPLVFVSGREMNVDGQTVYHGCVQPAMGPQTMVNFAFSGAAEAMALEPKTPWIAAEGQIEGYDQIWANSNRFNYAYLPYKPTDLNGTPVPPPQRPGSSQNVAAWANVLQMSLDAVRRVTSFDPALGQMPGRQMSADAIEMLQAQGQKGNSGYLDSMRRAYLRLGQILVEAIPVYYDRPGRVVKILGLEDKADVAMLNAPHTMNAQGQPVQAMSQPMGQPVMGDVLHYDLTKGRYSCTVEVGKSFATKREEGVSALGELSKVVGPEQTSKFVDLWVKEMDFPGAEAIAKRLAPPNVAIQGLPPAAQQLVQSLQAQVQQLQGAIQTKTAEIQAKGQIDLAKEQAANETQIQIAQAKNQTDLTKAEISASATMSVAQAKVDAENFRSYIDTLEQRIAKDADLRFKIAQTIAGHHAAAAEATAARTHDVMTQALEHAHDHAMADHSAALAPQPAEPAAPEATTP
jgi:hypothetical protein